MPHQCTNCGQTFADGSKEMLSGCPGCSGTKFQFQPDGFDDSDSTSGDNIDSDPRPSKQPTSATPPGGTSSVDNSPETSDRPGDPVTRTVGSAAATVRDLVGGSAGPDATAATPRTDSGATSADTGGDDGDDIIVAESEPISAGAGENTAQADARSAVIESEDVPETDGFDPTASADSATVVESGDDTTMESVDDRDVSIDESIADDSLTGVDSVVDDDTDRTESEIRDVTSDPSAERSVTEEPDAERADRPDIAELRDELNEQFESIRVVEPGQYELNLMELYDREAYIIALQEDGRYSIQMPDDWRGPDT